MVFIDLVLLCVSRRNGAGMGTGWCCTDVQHLVNTGSLQKRVYNGKNGKVRRAYPWNRRVSVSLLCFLYTVSCLHNDAFGPRLLLSVCVTSIPWGCLEHSLAHAGSRQLAVPDGNPPCRPHMTSPLNVWALILGFCSSLFCVYLFIFLSIVLYN